MSAPRGRGAGGGGRDEVRIRHGSAARDATSTQNGPRGDVDAADGARATERPLITPRAGLEPARSGLVELGPLGGLRAGLRDRRRLGGTEDVPIPQVPGALARLRRAAADAAPSPLPTARLR